MTNTKPQRKTTNPFDDDYESGGDGLDDGKSCDADGGDGKPSEVYKSDDQTSRVVHTNDTKLLEIHRDGKKTKDFYGTGGMSHYVYGNYGPSDQVYWQDWGTSEAYGMSGGCYMDERCMVGGYRDSVRSRKTPETFEGDKNQRDYFNNELGGIETRKTKLLELDTEESKKSCKLKTTESFRIESMDDIAKRKTVEISQFNTENGQPLKFFKVNCTKDKKNPTQHNRKYPNQYINDNNITKIDCDENKTSNISYKRKNSEKYKMEDRDSNKLKLDSVSKIRSSLTKYSLFSKNGRKNLKLKIVSFFGIRKKISDEKEGIEEKPETKERRKLIENKNPKDSNELNMILAKLKQEMVEKKMKCAMDYEEKITSITDKWSDEVMQAMRRHHFN